MFKNFWVFILGLFIAGSAWGQTPGCEGRFKSGGEAHAQWTGYLKDTRQSLTQLRNLESGWVQDRARTEEGGSLRILKSFTSPTNIALDLLDLTEQVFSDPGSESRLLARLRMKKALVNLSRARHHAASGLFYSWYFTDASGAVASWNVSSVDNIHLALALWTISESFPGTPLQSLASGLIKRMDFSEFYDRETALFGGNLKYQDGQWSLEAYRYDGLGSESRSIYALAWALGLFNGAKDDGFPARAALALNAEFFVAGENAKILRTWDGGAFQLLLPGLLMGEDQLSPQLAESFKNFAHYALREGKRRNLPVPATHSASGSLLTGYIAKSGSLDLVSTRNNDIHDPDLRSLWESVFTPHAAILAASFNPELLSEPLARAEDLGAEQNLLYHPGLGFKDGLHLSGEFAGQVIPEFFSLNQGMIALALAQITSSDRLTVSARALRNNPEVWKRLTQFYEHVNRRLSQL